MHVSGLFVFPVKSLAGFCTESMTLDGRGPEGDRRLVAVDAESGRFVTQRQWPSMVLIRAVWESANVLLLIDAQGNDLRVDIFRSLGPRRVVSVWRDDVRACDLGDEVAAWLSERIGLKLRLMFQDDVAHRYVDPEYATGREQVSFADGFPLLVISQSSLDFINRHLETPITMARFRPNLVVSGCDAFAEDYWKRIRIGQIEMDVVKPCSRCEIPSINPDTAQREPAVAKVLMRLRRWEDGAVYVGQNVIHRHKGCIRLGDEVEVLA